MKKFDYEKCKEWYAEEATAALYWCKMEQVFVNSENQEVDWLDRTKGEWKQLWKIIAYYPYTTITYVDRNQEISPFNFSIGGPNDPETKGFASLLFDVWFGYVEKKYHKSDNKTALKLQNRITGEVVYLGWYDGEFTVTKLPPNQRWGNPVEINEE